MKKIGKKKAQASLELTLGILCVLLLLVGTLRVFIWVNERMILRQEDYEGTGDSAQYGRVVAGSADTYVPLREETEPAHYPDLDLNLAR